MDELEQRLSSALTEMAEEVPPSRDAWAEHQRRLAVRRRRAWVRPVLMAAAVAAAVAMIVIPMVLLAGGRKDKVELAAPPTSETRSTPPPRSSPMAVPYEEKPGQTLLVPPYQVGTVRKDGQYLGSFVYVVQDANSGVRSLCTAVALPGQPVNGASQACGQFGPPANGKLLWRQVGVSIEGGGAWVYVTADMVKSALARTVNGAWASGAVIGKGTDFTVLLVWTPTEAPPANLTLRGAADNVLEHH